MPRARISAVGSSANVGLGAFLPRANVAGAGSIAGGTDEPAYDAGTDTIIHVGDSSDSAYASATAAGATSPATARFVPTSSPAYDGGSVDTTRCQIVAGIGGVGKGLYAFFPSDSAQEGPGWAGYKCPSYDVSKTTIIRAMITFSGTMAIGEEMAVKFCRIEAGGAANGGAAPQFSTHNHLPWTGSVGSIATFWQVYNAGYTDDSGQDQATQPVGPYLYQLFDGSPHRFTFAWRPHSATGVYDGFQRMWIDGTKVLDCSLAMVGVTPAGGAKPWTSLQMVQHCLVAGDVGTSGAPRFGGTQSTLSKPDWGMTVNVGDADPTNTDTLLWLKRP